MRRGSSPYGCVEHGKRREHAGEEYQRYGGVHGQRERRHYGRKCVAEPMKREDNTENTREHQRSGRKGPREKGQVCRRTLHAKSISPCPYTNFGIALDCADRNISVLEFTVVSKGIKTLAVPAQLCQSWCRGVIDSLRL